MSGEGDCNAPQNSNNVIKILLATDIHLGFDYNKKRGTESQDSFITFEEILQYGQKNEVDFVLLGGDLFHDTKPSQTVILRCMELLRKYCLGTRQIQIQFLSDPNVVFQHCAYKTVNYEDPNLNISMPVFSIHGNHDDPSFGAVGSMDILSVSGLINYFGKWTDLTQITIPPLIIKKGETHIALYGLSYINDQRLSRLLRDCKVEMLRPTEIQECFNMLVLHQNRVEHTKYQYIPQTRLPNFLNLIVWGHEHECRITPDFIPEPEYFISQPGSSIATSLCEGEAKPKHVGILHVNKMKFKIKKIKLQTVRPFVFDNLILEDQEIPRSFTETRSESVYKFVDDYIENTLMPKAAEQLSGHPQQPIQPLLRLRIFCNSDEEMFDSNKIAQKYCDEVANPMDMIVFRKQMRGEGHSRSRISNLNDDMDEMAQVLCYNDEDMDWNKTVQGGIQKHFSLVENRQQLTILTVNGLNEALNQFVDRGDTDAFKDVINHQMKKTIEHLEKCDVDSSETICTEIRNFRDKRLEKEQEETLEIQAMLNNETDRRQNNRDTAIDDSDREEETNAAASAAKTTRGRGGRGRGSRGGSRGKGKANNKISPTGTSPTKPQRGRRQTKITDQVGKVVNPILVIDDSD